MSGSSGGPRITSTTTSCNQLSFIAQLASPKEEVVDQLQINSVLEIVSGEQNGQSVVHALWRGQVAGGIADSRLQRLRQCMSEDIIYTAKVVTINNGQVRIHIYPVGSNARSAS
ncbi:hypothetical protein [Pseudomonas sp. Cab53]|jgi:hypothetical protein|uniref:hypothetical protein n=1 Tax=Pseudomonas sp. Cab53 TaxID=2678258 RepID=UPI001BB40DDC|nr:hypothetical protein [Pseudomonas sp. Cab53]